MHQIWINDYQPAITDGDNLNSAGGGLWIDALMGGLEEKDISSVFVGPSKTTTSPRIYGRPPSAIVLNWRWQMPAYPQRQIAYERQMFLIEFAKEHKVPVLIYDLDLMDPQGVIAAHDDLARAGCVCIVSCPAFSPKVEHYTKLMPVAPSTNYMNPNHSKKNVYRMYIGNNYGRINQMKREWGKKSFVAYGNWLELSDGRESPEELSKMFPHGVFKGRLPQDKVFETLNTAYTTTHFAKPIYGCWGFITQRWAEAAIAGTIATAPEDFKHSLPADVYSAFRPQLREDTVVHNAYAYNEVLRMQRQVVNNIFGLEPWLDVLDYLFSHS